MRSGGERAFVAFGANLGDREQAFAAAIARLERERDLRLVAASPVFETPPLGPPGQPAYLNAVVEIRSWIAPHDLLGRLQAIERALGRDREHEVRWGPRPIDLDLLFFGDRQIATRDLELPHPRLHERAFVLVPMAAIAPEWRHPAFGISIRELVRARPAPDALRATVRPAGWPGAPEAGAA